MSFSIFAPNRANSQRRKRGRGCARKLKSEHRLDCLHIWRKALHHPQTPLVLNLNQTFKDTLESTEIQRKMLDQGAEPAYLDAEQFSQFLTKELPRWARVVQQAGAKIN